MSSSLDPHNNPLTPLAWLPPTLATELEIARYVSVGTFAAYAWDWLSSLRQEYKMISRDGPTIPIIVYMASRICTLAPTILMTVFLTFPASDCQALLQSVGWCMVALAPFTSYLFLIRILAIFRGQLAIIGLFIFLWLAVCGSAILVPLNIRADHIGTTRYCVPTHIETYAGFYGVVAMAHRLLVFLFISWKLTQVHRADFRLRSFFRVNRQEPSLISSVLLSSGQLYYFTIVGMNIANLVFVLSPNLSEASHVILNGPNIALENAMACRVFRQLKFDTQRQYIDSVINDLELPSHTSRRNSGPGLGFNAPVEENRHSIVLTDRRASDGIAQSERTKVHT